jgi:hypothetical protein
MAAALPFTRAQPSEVTVRPKRGKVTSVAWILPLLLGIYLLFVAWRCLVLHDQQSSTPTAQDTAPEANGVYPVPTAHQPVSNQGRVGKHVGKLLRVNQLHKGMWTDKDTNDTGAAPPLDSDDETPVIQLPPELQSIDAGIEAGDILVRNPHQYKNIIGGD